MTAVSAVPGLDVAAFAGWLAEALPGVDPTTARADLIAGGKSNLTYRATLGELTCIVRRPPLGHVQATAHDMAREYRVMSALVPTDVPVPRTLALCEDPAVTGAVFYVMEDVAGTPYRTAAELAGLGPERVRTVSTALVDTLIALHQVDPAAVGLADFGRPEGFPERQVRRWTRQLEGSRTRPLPAADELRGRLERNLPPPRPSRIVHGDYRLDNVLIDAADRPAAVIDWEMATLGDPLTDLALLLVYGRVGEIAGGEAVADAASAPGFLTESELVARYAAGTGSEPTGFGFYLGLAAYKLAGILEGIHYRFLHGQTVGAGFEGVGAVTEPLLDLGLDAMKEYS
ncbi:phosphotransferase family protein [Nocardioides marmoriginsengisoli]|uniref:Phosphotransferase family protein n=1 Tax=Nocardioides marmoriginsengisoli TaxID=661483 RepID=A0A3N0CG85_9ACTN|nr:phosphotransferase family protein [Nocardioides marmoriginsengisoli]RNL62480.1 phosphotransferase family protein [Nocardioides marmoriginsengisoli]